MNPAPPPTAQSEPQASHPMKNTPSHFLPYFVISTKKMPFFEHHPDLLTGLPKTRSTKHEGALFLAIFLLAKHVFSTPRHRIVAS